MKKVNLILMLGAFLTCTSTVRASYEDEMELRTMSKIEAQEDGYSLGATKEEIDLMAAIVEAEAGNQDLMGKRLVVDVILNRVDSDYFPGEVEKVIYQQNQFTSINDGNFDKAKSNISDESYAAVYDELLARTDHDILYFTANDYGQYGIPAYQYQDHFFCR